MSGGLVLMSWRFAPDEASLDVLHRAAAADSPETLAHLMDGGGWERLRALLNRSWTEEELSRVLLKHTHSSPRAEELTLEELARHWGCGQLRSKGEHIAAIVDKVARGAEQNEWQNERRMTIDTPLSSSTRCVNALDAPCHSDCGYGGYTAYGFSRPDRGWTPLAIAVLHHSEAATKFLVSRGADINARRIDREHTPLQEAIYRKDEAAVALCVKAGASVRPIELMCVTNQWTELHNQRDFWGGPGLSRLDALVDSIGERFTTRLSAPPPGRSTTASPTPPDASLSSLSLPSPPALWAVEVSNGVSHEDLLSGSLRVAVAARALGIRAVLEPLREGRAREQANARVARRRQRRGQGGVARFLGCRQHGRVVRGE